MQVESFMLCHAATSDGGKLNVLGAFDSIYTKTVPAKHPSCALALRIRFDRAEQGRHQIKLAMVDADGKSVGKFPEAVCEVRMADNQSYAVVNQIVNLIGLPFKDYGNYAIDLSIDNRHEASLPLEVRPIPQSPNAGATDADEPWAT